MCFNRFILPLNQQKKQKIAESHGISLVIAIFVA